MKYKSAYYFFILNTYKQSSDAVHGSLGVGRASYLY